MKWGILPDQWANLNAVQIVEVMAFHYDTFGPTRQQLESQVRNGKIWQVVDAVAFYGLD